MISGLKVGMGGSMARHQYVFRDSWEGGRTDRDRGGRRNGGNHFPVRVQRIVAFELVLFTCYIRQAELIGDVTRWNRERD
jgi:hypothetical protein